MKPSEKLENYIVGPNLQMLFIWLSIASILAQIGLFAFFTAQQLRYNHDLSGFLLNTVYYLAVPVIMFVIAYVTAGKDRSTRASVFESFLFVSIGTFIFGILNQASTILLQRWILSRPNGNFWHTVLYNLGSATVTLVIYTAFVVKFRLSHKKSA
jgi:hypothetical protein